MKYNELGQSGIKVSELCLGTMTWGSQNSQEEASQQINIAVENGINFLDTAEMYPTTPISKSTLGETERIIGRCLKENKKRNKLIIATKITGKGFSAIRNGAAISSSNLRLALEGSLRRLQTDYIDLYQLHWANRGSYHFRRNWEFNPSSQSTKHELAQFFEILYELDKFVAEGKIRSIGLSNETSWGTQQFLKISRENNLSRIVSIQNEYSLLCRYFDTDLAEICHHEKIGLLSYSPLSCGLLSGKYLNDKIPKNSRRSINSNLSNRINEVAIEASNAYIDLAKSYNFDPSQMALSFCISRPFMTSVIFGSTTERQLINNLKSKDLKLSKKMEKEILKIYKKYPIPF